MAEAAVGVATAQGPVGASGDRLLHLGIVAAELAEDEDGVEAGVDVPVGLLDVPAAVGLLVPQHPGDHVFGRGVGSPSSRKKWAMWKVAAT